MNQRKYSEDRFASFRTIGIIVGLLVLWVTILCAGVILHSDNGFAKSAIMLGAVGLFCGFWVSAAALREHRQASRSAKEKAASDETAGD